MFPEDNPRMTLQLLQDKLGELRPTEISEAERKVLLGQARELVKFLEKPEEVVFRQSFETHTYNFSIRIAVDLGIFHVLVERLGEPVGPAELGALCGAQELLIVRIMRVLTALDYAAESTECEYVANSFSRACTLPHIEAYILHTFENAARVTNRMPEYFKEHGYESPENGTKGPFQYAQNTSLAYFDYLH
ncbi:hypothetical protein N0V82_007388 [Gnomoniopsis sp. IMI 355080]|nr:hypothetical protein N0V82_007388 [Gnomoniopsis sp. IMI 355080]